MAEIIDGKKIAKELNKKTLREIEDLDGKRPGLAIILVGQKEDSKLYVDLKEKEARKVGIETHVYKCAEDTEEEKVLEIIEHLNVDDEIDAILVQLPLPKNFNTSKIIKAIELKKDVDLFHPENIKILQSTCSHNHMMPPVLGVVLEMLEKINFDAKEKTGCVIANSDIFGESLAKVLQCKGMHIESCGPDDADLVEKTLKADVLISAIGRPGFVGAEMVKNDAVVIDVGITKRGKKVLGDVDFDDVEKKASYITPVPGGVGPATVAMLLLNTVRLATNNK
ncbi:MAG: tetrahydrofolate dehydrogenase/cyclohydrolase catalytic domain-containing protein [Patescibacteria group bacterium]|nr:tetrahydrofolate dehydrogenase/cyclohydrolase catalytic domain-containing protein [Patescibacteria group bacterium]